MKIFCALLLLVLVGFVPVDAQAQVGTSCMGCMPRTGQVYDSTKTTPAPPFTTSASTGEVYIPPREVIVTVPGPSAPVPTSNDPTSFSSTKFTCSAGGVGHNGAQGAALTLYQNIGGRCADTEGLTFWATNLVNCVAGNPKYGWGVANAADTSFYMSELGRCGIVAGVTDNINTSADQNSMNQVCANDAATRGFVTTAYTYVRGASSSICSK